MKDCSNLKEWPKYFYKLVNLTLLDIRECQELKCMPLGIGQLTNLRGLTNFKVGSVSSNRKQCKGELKDLKLLVNLRGELDITIGENLASEKEYVWDGGYLEHIKNLKVVEIEFDQDEEVDETNNDAVIGKLQPNRNLMELRLYEYNGTEIPRWGRAVDDWAINLPNLVNIKLGGCERLNGIPLLSNLKHLKSLTLSELNNLEYMEIRTFSRGSYGLKDLPFFPALEFLFILNLERMKGWWGGVDDGDSSSGMPHWQSPFPRLSRLIIISCPKLASFPPCPSLESLEVTSSNKAFRILPGDGPPNSNLKLRVKEIDNVGYLSTLPVCRVTHITITADEKLKRLSKIEEVFKNFSSLQSLEIRWCSRLRSISGVLEHLTALKSLSLFFLPALVDDLDDNMPWRSLCPNLRYLKLEFLCSLQILPRWISRLSSLHCLTIDSCTVLKSLDAIRNITSLEQLVIVNCPELREACRKPSGKEWPNIRRIPYITFSDTQDYDSEE